MAFVIILLDFLLQWPTLLKLVIFHALLVMYGRFAVTEETETRVEFVSDSAGYAAVVSYTQESNACPLMPCCGCQRMSEAEVL